jgi:hypothetical protein
MRTLTIANQCWGIDAALEMEWPGIERLARDAARGRGDGKPIIKFEAEGGTFGSFPVSPLMPITFGEADDGDQQLGMIKSLRAKP